MAVDPLAQRLSTFIAEMRRLLDELESAPILQDLTISSVIARVGQAITIAIEGAIDGAAIAGIPPDGMRLDSDARTISGTPTQDGVYEIPLTQTLDGARNSPHPSTVSITVEPALPVARGVTLGNSTIRLGNSKVRMNGVGGGGGTSPKPNLSLSGPATLTEGNPGSTPVAALTLSGPASLTEGNPSATPGPLTLSGPASIAEGNPTAAALTLSGPSILSEGN